MVKIFQQIIACTDHKDKEDTVKNVECKSEIIVTRFVPKKQ